MSDTKSVSKRPTHFLGTPATTSGPLGPDMLRAFQTIRRDPLAYLNSVWREHGDITQFPVPRPPSYLVNSPAGVRQVLVDNARGYDKSTIQYRALSLVTGEGLLTSDGSLWRGQRRVLNRRFIIPPSRRSAATWPRQRNALPISGRRCRADRLWMSMRS